MSEEEAKIHVYDVLRRFTSLPEECIQKITKFTTIPINKNTVDAALIEVGFEQDSRDKDLWDLKIYPKVKARIHPAYCDIIICEQDVAVYSANITKIPEVVHVIQHFNKIKD